MGWSLPRAVEEQAIGICICVCICICIFICICNLKLYLYLFVSVFSSLQGGVSYYPFLPSPDTALWFGFLDLLQGIFILSNCDFCPSQTHPYGETGRLWRLLLPRYKQAWHCKSRNSNSCRGEIHIILYSQGALYTPPLPEIHPSNPICPRIAIRCYIHL